ncbi:hypothetical protein C8J57DRAFT_1706501 [Mycena rebaudengoi]|nr:hypothetical protein C8J57DRAFT_1706501 [Mycena rebaudengoi]
MDPYPETEIRPPTRGFARQLPTSLLLARACTRQPHHASRTGRRRRPPAHLPGARPSPAHRRPTTPATPAPAAPLHHKTAACCLPASAVGRPSTSAAPAACVPHLAQHPNPASFRPGLFASIVQCSHYNGHRLKSACCCPLAPTRSTTAPPQWPAPLPSLAIQILSLRTISSRNAESPPPSDCPRHHHNLHHLPRLSIRQTSLYPKTGPTAHILRLPTPLTFFSHHEIDPLSSHSLAAESPPFPFLHPHPPHEFYGVQNAPPLTISLSSCLRLHPPLYTTTPPAARFLVSPAVLVLFRALGSAVPLTHPATLSDMSPTPAIDTLGLRLHCRSGECLNLSIHSPPLPDFLLAALLVAFACRTSLALRRLHERRPHSSQRRLRASIF